MTLKRMRSETNRIVSASTTASDLKPPRSPKAVQLSYMRGGLAMTGSSLSYVSTATYQSPSSPPRTDTRPGSPVQMKHYEDENFFCYDSDEEEECSEDDLFGLAFVQEE